MKVKIAMAIFCLFTISVIGQSKKERKAQEEAKELQDYQETQELISSKNYEFEGSWARSQRGMRIDLIGNPNYIRIKNDSVFAYLPFFGERFSGGGYDGSGAIEVGASLKNYKVKFNDKKQRIEIEFSASNGTESFDFNLTVFGSKNGNVYVSSSQRSSMNYDGSYSEIKEEVSEEAKE